MSEPATMQSTPPTTALETTVSPSSAMHTIIIPGRPQARRDTDTGRAWLYAARTQLERDLPSTIFKPTGEIAIDLHLYYPSDRLGLERDAFKLPRTDRAAELAVHALYGTLINHHEQINPITITRHLEHSTHLEHQHGRECRHGLTIIRWSHAIT